MKVRRTWGETPEELSVYDAMLKTTVYHEGKLEKLDSEVDMLMRVVAALVEKSNLTTQEILELTENHYSYKPYEE